MLAGEKRHFDVCHQFLCRSKKGGVIFKQIFDCNDIKR